MVSRRVLALGFALALSVGVLGCTAQEQVAPPMGSESERQSPDDTSPATPEATEPDAAESQIAWLDTPLVDAVTGESFRVSDLKGEPVLLHAFAVW